ncbi:MAG: hypothetical protein SCG72_05400 [Nitrosarchaeum sp.]|jgi:hypothetical protein|nr:hypothetical protein [Nitrosarchaeum sp.]
MYKATIQISYTSSSDNACDDILPEENIKMEVPAEDLNIHQYFHLFNRFLRSIGFCDYSIMQGGVQLAFNDMRDQKEMQKVANEYGLILEEDFPNDEIEKENEKLQSEVLDLRAKLSRLENPNYPNYTDQEIEAMCANET